MSETIDLDKKLKAVKRVLAAKKSQDNMRDFMRFMIPDEVDPDDTDLSEYQITPHGNLLCELMMKVEQGKLKKAAVSIPPQHGKTWHISTYGVAWILGRNPRAKVVVASYNETRAEELGEMFRRIVMSPAYRQVFPDFDLDRGSKSKSAMTTTKGGTIFFVGAGGTVTGRTAQFFIIDDPIKDDKEVQSETFREDMWKWFFSVAYSRGSKNSRMVVVHTRWHTDDLIGRLCDPEHPERNKRFSNIAQDWLYLNISGVVTDEKLARALGLTLEVPTDPYIVEAFGAKPMAALWEADKDLAHFARWKFGDPGTFQALVMGRPSAEDGEYFKAEWLVEYDPHELPDNLQIYAASDHAVSEKERRDYTVLGCVGVDEKDNIWVLPDLVWERMQTDRTVEEIIQMMKNRRPFYWWMESEMISKSFGPFLRKRMIEENVYIPIDEVTVSKDKMTRARAIQGRLSMQKVRFPRFAPWWQDARTQLLKFPTGSNDDFVDFLSHIGLGLVKQFTPSTQTSKNETNVVRVGSPQWIVRQSALRAARQQREKAIAGW